jgi:hypothetical protein
LRFHGRAARNAVILTMEAAVAMSLCMRVIAYLLSVSFLTAAPSGLSLALSPVTGGGVRQAWRAG